MAKRYTGRYSPDTQRDQPRGSDLPARAIPGDIRHPQESRTRWVTIAATPLLVSAFFQDPLIMATSLAGFGILASGMWMTREGLRAEAAYNARRVARRPAFPRKLFGGVLTGLGLAVGSYEPGTAAMAGAGIIGVVGSILQWLTFGTDPMRDKGMEGIDSFQQDRVARIVAEGEDYLRAMRDAILRTGDRRLEARVHLFSATARELFARVEEDPGDLAAARRYLGVYLMGARDATVKFADLYAQTRDERARADYEALLADLETNFAARTRQLIEGSRTNLDIEMQVLSERLAREGIRTDDTMTYLNRPVPENLILPEGSKTRDRRD
ncbi:5-bromo-4-chloroindolyl phosphate hydrolysis family protein [Paracoccus sp. DMF-8]|uniref:5-bromo-4-chloroindolyl phosphate hydrolysis family protein n=1 Tax=Paracoccus sp. DMF-8 TaxID=3019445 RepID=UPI0023E3A276|nr:5-bromo-4-chloroindolyl phosphate hydrolysis family protein [Paracoccus sp. DMF-8]MDF3607791.1 5-bromo-4-chloroindolyl phosphate hydrolysis family protein [Paracoccus sp. DMF-8]